MEEAMQIDAGVGNIWEISVSYPQICCGLKTAVKIVLIKK